MVITRSQVLDVLSLVQCVRVLSLLDRTYYLDQTSKENFKRYKSREFITNVYLLIKLFQECQFALTSSQLERQRINSREITLGKECYWWTMTLMIRHLPGNLKRTFKFCNKPPQSNRITRLSFTVESLDKQPE